MDLKECLWGENRLSVRRIDTLVNNLSLRSSLARRYTEDWGYQEELLASLIEVVDIGNIHFLMAHGTKGAQLPKPVKIPRPGSPRVKRTATPQEVADIFKANLRVVHKNGGGGES